jgi:sugar phosphate isomerase/epimerase
LSEPRPLALQMWTIREIFDTDPAQALRRAAELGFRAVEPYGVIGRQDVPAAERIEQAAALRRLLDDIGLTVCSIHGPVPADSEFEALFDEMETLGIDCLIAAAPPAIAGCESALSSTDGVRRMADRLNACAARAATRGISVGYHNHWHEFDVLDDGAVPFDVLWRHLEPEVVAEIDIYWAHVGTGDPAAVIEALGERVRFLHVKDGPADTENPQTALGHGGIDLDAALAAGTHARWHIVELDDAADVFGSAVAGGEWLVEHGWSRWAIDA